MKIRRKILAIILVTTASMMLIIYAASQTILLNSFAKLEQQQVNQNVQRVLSALSNEYADLSSKCADWAQWDDTYTYVQDLNSNYAQANLVNSSFINVRANFILFINSSGQIVSETGFDLKNLTWIPVPQSLSQLILTHNALWQFQSTTDSVSGLVLLPENPLLLASRPILTSQGQGPIRGALIFARYFTSDEVGLLAQMVHLPLTMHRVGDSQAPPDFQTASQSLSTTTPLFINPLNSDTVSGYALINDVFGQPILTLRADLSRDIFKQGQTTINYMLLFLFSSSIVFSAMIVLLLEKSVLTRLTELTADVSCIGIDKGFSARVNMTGSDELSALASSVNGLLTEIEDKTTQLQKSQRFATIGELATMVAHDLRNPLQGIANAAFYLKRKVAPKGDSKQLEMLQLIEEDVRYSDKIINDLLDYSKEMRLDLMETNPHSIMKEALSTVEVPVNVKVVDAVGSEPKIKVDASSMRRAFVNVIRNAIEAMPNGGTLTLSSKESYGDAEFIFADTGVGIAEENFGKLFTPLFTTKAKGMGFGLSICKRIIEAHGGKISFESTVGKGTIFTITVPAQPKLEEGYEEGGEKSWMEESPSLSSTTMTA